MAEYTPTEHEVRLVWSEWSSYGGLTDRPDYDATRTEMRAEFDRFLTRIRRDAAQAALLGAEQYIRANMDEPYGDRSANRVADYARTYRTEGTQ